MIKGQFSKIIRARYYSTDYVRQVFGITRKTEEQILAASKPQPTFSKPKFEEDYLSQNRELDKKQPIRAFFRKNLYILVKNDKYYRYFLIGATLMALQFGFYYIEFGMKSEQYSLIHSTIKHLNEIPLYIETVGDDADCLKDEEAEFAFNNMKHLGRFKLPIESENGKFYIRTVLRRTGTHWSSDFIELCDENEKIIHRFPGKQPFSKIEYF